MPFLVCTNLKKGAEWHAAVASDPFTLGFSEDATIPLPDRALAPNEALVRRVGDRYQLVDLAERDRVRLNGAVVRSALLTEGDLIQVGRIAIRFHEDVRREDLLVVVGDRGPPRGAADSPWASADGRVALDFEREAGGAGLAEGPSRLPWIVVVLSAVAFAVGLALGYRGFGLRFGPGPAPAAVKVERPELPEAAREAEGTGAVEAARLAAEAVRVAEAAPAPAVAAPEPTPSAGAVPASAHAGAESLSPAFVKLTAISSGFAPPEPDDAATARRRLFRLALDILERPPTRAEEREWLASTTPERWRRLAALAPEAPGWLASPAEAARRLLGRGPTEVEERELAKVASPELPAAFWLSLGEEYARAGRVRAKTTRQLAASLVVDLEDRVPSGEEVAAVAAAIEARGRGSPLDLRLLRAIAFSPSSRLGEEGPGGVWEEEFFRFALREPTLAERERLGRSYGALERGERRKWLLLALTSLPEYRTY